MSNEGSNELIFGADTGAFDKGSEFEHDSHDGIADADHFSLCNVHSADDEDILNRIEDPPCSVQPVDIELDSIDNSNDNELESERETNPEKKVYCSSLYVQKIVSLDLEHDSQYCGIVKLSCQLF